MKPTLIISFVLLFITADNHFTNSQWIQTSQTTGNISVLDANSNHVFALVGNGLRKTSNAGVIWESANMGCSDFCVNGTYIFAGQGGDPYVSRSSNNGISWATVGHINADGWFSVMASGNNIFASRYVMQRSTNSGDNWSIVQGVGSSWLQCIAADGSLVFALSSYTYLYRSTDNGNNWGAATIFPQQMYAMAISGSTVYAGMNNIGVQISTNSGITWGQSSLNNQIVRSLAVMGSSVFAGTQAAGVYFSTNAGATWVQKNEGLTNLNVTSLLINGDYVYLGTNGAGVWKRSLSELVGINIISTEIPKEYSLFQNYPNPFNPTTNIKFQMPNEAFVKLIVYNVLGKEVAVLVNQQLKAGTYEANFDGTNHPSGIYFYVLRANEYVQTRKMILAK